jgi:hypothetical protein
MSSYFCPADNANKVTAVLSSVLMSTLAVECISKRIFAVSFSDLLGETVEVLGQATII